MPADSEAVLGLCIDANTCGTLFKEGNGHHHRLVVDCGSALATMSLVLYQLTPADICAGANALEAQISFYMQRAGESVEVGIKDYPCGSRNWVLLLNTPHGMLTATAMHCHKVNK